MSEAEEGASLKFKCGNCGARFRVSERDRGKNVRCPECGKALRVPARSAPVRGTPPRGVPTPPAGQATTPDPTSSDQLMVDGLFRQMQEEAVQTPGSAPTGSHGAGAPRSPEDVVGQLERLAALKQQGIVTEAEFLAQKSRILATAPAAPGPDIQGTHTPSGDLVDCQECGKRFWRLAESCPNCGNPVSKPKKKPTREATLAVLLGIGSCWLWFGPHLYFIFPMDSALFGAVLLLYGVIKFAKVS